jgi:hypothetical protein
MNSEFTSAGNIFVAELVNIASGYYTLDNIENIK